MKLILNLQDYNNRLLGFDFEPLLFNFFFINIFGLGRVDSIIFFWNPNLIQIRSGSKKWTQPKLEIQHNPTQSLYFGLGRIGFLSFQVGCTPLKDIDIPMQLKTTKHGHFSRISYSINKVPIINNVFKNSIE